MNRELGLCDGAGLRASLGFRMPWLWADAVYANNKDAHSALVMAVMKTQRT